MVCCLKRGQTTQKSQLLVREILFKKMIRQLLSGGRYRIFVIECVILQVKQYMGRLDTFFALFKDPLNVRKILPYKLVLVRVLVLLEDVLNRTQTWLRSACAYVVGVVGVPIRQETPSLFERTPLGYVIAHYETRGLLEGYEPTAALRRMVPLPGKPMGIQTKLKVYTRQMLVPTHEAFFQSYIALMGKTFRMRREPREGLLVAEIKKHFPLETWRAPSPLIFETILRVHRCHPVE